MSQAQELLNSLTANVIDHKHEVPDSDTYFLIDPYTRQIENTNYNKTVLMRGDHNSERFTFEVPRFVDGHDMSLCNRVIVHFDNVGDSIEKVYSDVAYMEDLRINPDKPETVISSWLIRREATQIVGILSFSLQYQCVEDGEITYEWNTDSYDEIEIRKSKNNGEAAIINYTNVLEEWRSKIFGAGDSVMANISAEGVTQVTAVQTESATQQAAIELKGSTTLASIPEDYTEVYNMAEEALRTKADSIVCEAEGPIIAVTDSSDDHIRGLNVYGKSTQVTTTGKNLFDVSKIANNSRVTNNNGLITVSTPEASSAVDSMTNLGVIAPGLEVGKSYTLTFETTGTDKYIYLEEAKFMWSNGGTNTVTQEMLDADVLFYASGVSTTATLTNFMLRDSSITDATYEPYTGGVATPNPDYPQEIMGVENPTVSVIGRNLIRYPYRAESAYNNGITFTANSDGTVTANGTATDTAYFTMQNIADHSTTIPISKGTYVLSGAPIEYCRMSIALWKNKKRAATYSAYVSQPLVFTIDEDDITFDVVCTVDTGAVLDNVVFKPKLEVGSIPTPYEPYIAPQTVTITNTLHGIPVTSGGNYTDENGQQWNCDEVDLERGVYIRRTGEIVFDGTKNYHINSYRLDYGYYAFGCTMEDLQPVNNMPLVSDKFTHKLWHDWQPETDRNLVCYTGYAFYFYLNDGVTKTANDFKAYVTENPITVRHILPTPIETPLTAEEIEAYKSIKTNYPNTTILNDSGAWMKVKYNADLRRYIDRDKQQFTEDIIDQFRDTVTPAKIGWVTLPAAGWVGSDGLYYQVVDIPGVTENSQVDLTPDIEQLTIFYEKDLTFVTENDGGVVTVYAVGQKPENDYVVQVTITEVAV